jgi:pyruvate ferredoxin oxidoreductase gamma subunit
MYRIRFHGRGGQGIKTASRILGNAFFQEGFEVQDAPRYGAERRGAPIFAYVRAARERIDERGSIEHPDLVVVADESLVRLPAAGVLEGIESVGVLLIASAEPAEVWCERLGFSGLVLTLPADSIGDGAAATLLGAACVGAAARLLGVISREGLEAGIRQELAALADLDAATLEQNVGIAVRSYDRMAEREGCVHEGPQYARVTSPPGWVELASEPTSLAAPDIHGAATTEQVPTGLWRTQRPEIDADHCNRCSWICSTFCPDGAIDVGPEREPIIDYDHCKGCLMCVAVCPTHAIRVEPEAAAVEIHLPPPAARPSDSETPSGGGRGERGRSV